MQQHFGEVFKGISSSPAIFYAYLINGASLLSCKDNTYMKEMKEEKNGTECNSLHLLTLSWKKKIASLYSDIKLLIL